MLEKKVFRYIIRTAILESLNDEKTQKKEYLEIEYFHYQNKSFLPVDYCLSIDGQRQAENQNGVKINFKEQKISFTSFFSLLFVSHTMKKRYEDTLKSNYQYWFKKRAILNDFSECYFQYNMKKNRKEKNVFFFINETVQTPYLKMCEKYLEEKPIYFSPSISFWSRYFCKMPDFFIACSARTLLSFDTKTIEPKDLPNRLFYTFFDRSKDGPFNNDLNKKFIFLIALSLGLLMPNLPKKDLQAIYQDFIELRNLFNILVSEKPFIEEQKTLDSLRLFYVNTFNVNDKNHSIDFKSGFNKKDDYHGNLLLQSIENIAYYFLDFKTLLTKDDQEYYKNFSNEKKIFFIYCILKFNQFIPLACSFYYRSSHLDLLYSKIEAYLKFRQNNLVDICNLEFEKETKLKFLLGYLLSTNDITTCCYYLNFYSELDEKINTLFSLYSKMSYFCLAQYFSFLLDPKWEDKFKEIMESFMLRDNSLAVSTSNLFFENQKLEKEIQDKKEQIRVLNDQQSIIEVNILKLKDEYCIANEKKSELDLVITEMQKKIQVLNKIEEFNQVIERLENEAKKGQEKIDEQNEKIERLENEAKKGQEKINEQNEKIERLENEAKKDQRKMSFFKKLFFVFFLMGSQLFLYSLYLWGISAKTI